MKVISSKFGVIPVAIGLTIFAFTEVWGENWKSLYKDELFTLFYDAESITRPSKNIVRVKNKRIYTEKGKNEMVKMGGKAYKDLNLSISLLEINCVDIMARPISMSHYSQGGSIIGSSENKEKAWVLIDPGSIGEPLYKEVCK